MEKLDNRPEYEKALEATIEHYKPMMLTNSEFAFMATGQLVMEFAREFDFNPFYEFQKKFNEKGINVKIVALPKGVYINGSELEFIDGTAGEYNPNDFDIKMPHTGDVEYPYYAWIIANKPHEYSQMLAELGVSEEENLERLKETGVQVTKAGTKTDKKASEL